MMKNTFGLILGRFAILPQESVWYTLSKLNIKTNACILIMMFMTYILSSLFLTGLTVKYLEQHLYFFLIIKPLIYLYYGIYNMCIENITPPPHMVSWKRQSFKLFYNFQYLKLIRNRNSKWIFLIVTLKVLFQLNYFKWRLAFIISGSCFKL